MYARIAFAVMALAYGMASDTPAVAQHHASKPKAEKPKSDAELIANAMSAAPLAVSKDATVVAVGSDGKLRTLRHGQGPFTCVPDDPSSPGNDPMCLDRSGFEWFKALLAHEKPPEGKVWLVYMLKGGSDADNDDPFASEPQKGKKWVQTGPQGWAEGRTMRTDIRWAAGGNPKLYAKELIAQQPDVILVSGTPVTAALQRETRTIPIVFVEGSAPVGSSFVAGLPRPGRNITGFS